MIINGTNIGLIRGDTAIFSLSLIDMNDNPIIFEVGDKVYFTIKTSTQTNKISVQKVFNVQQSSEELRIELEPSDTRELKYAKYWYDIQYNKANGEVHTVVPASVFEILEEVTYE